MFKYIFSGIFLEKLLYLLILAFKKIKNIRNCADGDVLCTVSVLERDEGYTKK